MKTARVGIMPLESFKRRCFDIVGGAYKPEPNEPKLWFSSRKGFERALSPANRALLAEIAETEPASVSELSRTTGRARSGLSRALATLERHGLIGFEEGKGGRRAPRALYSHVELWTPPRAPRPDEGARPADFR